MSIQCYMSKPQLQGYFLGQTDLHFLKVNHPLVSYYGKKYDLPVDEKCHYVYLNGVIGAVRYYEQGIWFVDVAVHKSVRGKKARDACNNLLRIFSILFYVLGYIGIIKK